MSAVNDAFVSVLSFEGSVAPGSVTVTEQYALILLAVAAVMFVLPAETEWQKTNMKH